MRAVLGWCTAGLLLLGSLALVQVPVVLVTGLALLLDFPFRLGPVAALCASVGIGVVSLILMLVVEVPLKVMLRNAPERIREAAVDVASVLLLAAGLRIIVESFLASLLMAALSAAILVALSPLIDRAEAATEDLPGDTD